MNKELTQGPLLDKKGNLVEPGFSNSLIKEYKRSMIHGKKWRIKEWDYYYIGNQQYGLCLTISDVSYLALISVTFLDFRNRLQPAKTFLKPFTFGKMGLPSTSKEGDISFENKDCQMSFTHEDGKRHLKCHFTNFIDNQNLDADIVLEETNPNTIVVATPFKKKKHFYYNQKINLMKSKGSVKLGYNEYDFSKDTFGLLDWGRGVWTYKNTWYWSSLNARYNKHNIGFNLGYGFGDTSTHSENIFYYDDKAYKLEDVEFIIPTDNKGKDDYLSSWRMISKSGDINLTFKPILNRHDDTNVLLIRSKQNQVFGYFSGYFIVNEQKIEFEDLMGFAEKVYNRW